MLQAGLATEVPLCADHSRPFTQTRVAHGSPRTGTPGLFWQNSTQRASAARCAPMTTCVERRSLPVRSPRASIIRSNRLMQTPPTRSRAPSTAHGSCSGLLGKVRLLHLQPQRWCHSRLNSRMSSNASMSVRSNISLSTSDSQHRLHGAIGPSHVRAEHRSEPLLLYGNQSLVPKHLRPAPPHQLRLPRRDQKLRLPQALLRYPVLETSTTYS